MMNCYHPITNKNLSNYFNCKETRNEKTNLLNVAIEETNVVIEETNNVANVATIEETNNVATIETANRNTENNALNETLVTVNLFLNSAIRKFFSYFSYIFLDLIY